MTPEPNVPPVVYANVVQLTTGPYDVVMDFGFKMPEKLQKGSPEWDVVARVAMSLGHAKSMLPLLARAIAEYEDKYGEIVAPGFDKFSKE